MKGIPSKQDSKMGRTSYPLGITLFGPARRKFYFWPSNKSFADQACSVKCQDWLDIVLILLCFFTFTSSRSLTAEPFFCLFDFGVPGKDST